MSAASSEELGPATVYVETSYKAEFVENSLTASFPMTSGPSHCCWRVCVNFTTHWNRFDARCFHSTQRIHPLTQFPPFYRPQITSETNEAVFNCGLIFACDFISTSSLSQILYSEQINPIWRATSSCHKSTSNLHHSQYSLRRNFIFGNPSLEPRSTNNKEQIACPFQSVRARLSDALRARPVRAIVHGEQNSR